MKTFNCPFCKEKMRRELLVKHIEKNHDEEIPEGFTAYRLVYDIVNNHPDHMGHCTVCGKPTKWNEKRQKYERLCRDPKCYATVKKTYQKRILKVYNKTSLMDDPNHLEKMLAGRKISGKYKWSDGKVFTYTGAYEKNFMEFLDKVLEFKSNEILAPGPVLKYDYKGSEHMWITDFLILPYNLIVEIKDGGEGDEKNPNRRYMPDTRKRTVAKEKMITNLGKYSYIRLTNNEFNQFLSILAELKMNVNDKDDKPLYRIHENVLIKESEDIFENIDDDFDNEFKQQADEMDRLEKNARKVMDQLADKHSKSFKVNKTTYTTTDPNDRELTVVNIYTPKVKMANKHAKDKFKEMCYSLKEELDSMHSNYYDILSYFEDPDNVNEGFVVGIASKTSK